MSAPPTDDQNPYKKKTEKTNAVLSDDLCFQTNFWQMTIVVTNKWEDNRRSIYIFTFNIISLFHHFKTILSTKQSLFFQ